MDTHSIDFAVIGLGALGTATLYQLAKLGAKVVGIDRYLPPHPFGSSHGRARVTRNAVGEGSAYVPLVKRSQEILGELERSFNVDLMERSGTLIIGSEQPSNGEDFVKDTVTIAQQQGIEHELFSSAELKRRYLQLIGLTDLDYGYFEPQSGFLRPEVIISVQISAAQQLGATIIPNSVVKRISQNRGWIIIEADDRRIKARHAVVAAGRWAQDILGAPFDRLLTVSKQRTFSFKPEHLMRYHTVHFPALMWFRAPADDRCITVFSPSAQDDAATFFVEGIDTEADVSDAGNRFFEREIRPFFSGIAPRMASSAVCYYTTTPDGGFIIDHHPDLDQLLVLSACSGHGFKHSLAIGELAAQILLKKGTLVDTKSFSVRRFHT